MDERLSTRAPLWRWMGGNGGTWHFVTIVGEPAESLAATAIMRKLEGAGRGFGSLPVAATIGHTRWRTSVFPQKAGDGAPEWILPVKAAVRKAEGLAEGATVELDLEF